MRDRRKEQAEGTGYLRRKTRRLHSKKSAPLPSIKESLDSARFYHDEAERLARKLDSTLPDKESQISLIAAKYHDAINRYSQVLDLIQRLARNHDPAQGEGANNQLLEAKIREEIANIKVELSKIASY